MRCERAKNVPSPQTSVFFCVRKTQKVHLFKILQIAFLGSFNFGELTMLNRLKRAEYSSPNDLPLIKDKASGAPCL